MVRGFESIDLSHSNMNRIGFISHLRLSRLRTKRLQGLLALRPFVLEEATARTVHPAATVTTTVARRRVQVVTTGHRSLVGLDGVLPGSKGWIHTWVMLERYAICMNMHKPYDSFFHYILMLCEFKVKVYRRHLLCADDLELQRP